MPWHPPLIDSQILAVHAAVVPVGSKGTVLMFGGDEHNSAQGGTDTTPAAPAQVDRTALYDVAGRIAVRTTSPTTDVFCAGHAFLGDGRLLVGGGTESWGGADAGGPGGGHGHEHGNFGGHTACWVYHHHRNSWARVADFNFELVDHDGGGRWYPSIVTLPSGDLVAFGGHPSRRSSHWHHNDIPERYSPGSNRWFWYPNAIPFEHPEYPGNWYPRLSLVRGGWIFFTSISTGQCRFFDPGSGQLVGPVVPPPPPPYRVGWDYAVIQLPLVPGDAYRSRVMAVGAGQPAMIELNLDAGAPTPGWRNAGARTGSAAGTARRYACPVYLPTGQIIVTGGINGGDDDDAVKRPEVYTPQIDWATRSYTAGGGTWQTLEGDQAQVARNYHSVALLLPDGSVFTASSSKDGQPGNPDDAAQKNIELFLPAYFHDAARPSLVSAPAALNYAAGRFPVAVASAAQAAAIRKVALVRCGSVTHAGDFDQRYVVLAFTHDPGTANLTVEVPDDPSVLPPGTYMLWVVDQADRPCQQARFVRIAHQGLRVITDRSTFSKEEVEALGQGATATFGNAVYLHADGFVHTELTVTPAVELTWEDTGAPVPAGALTLVASPRLQEVYPGHLDTPQRLTFPFAARFAGTAAFAGFSDRRRVRATFRIGGLSASGTLDLTYQPNPYMVDIDENNEHWLSTDVRVFSLQAGEAMFGGLFQGSDPHAFLRQLLDALNAPGGNGLFSSLRRDATLDLASNGPGPMHLPVFNYAIARVRYRATTTQAHNVKCFLRMFNVAATGLEYDPTTTYRRTPLGPDTVPLLGVAGGEVASIPFFASPRVETVAGRPGATAMASQALDPAYERRTLVPGAAGGVVRAFFGAWLDINQTRKLIPITPGGSDGPWPDAACRSIQELARGRHWCAVAEVFFEPDPTAPRSTPGTSDNLSQRNLAILHSDNPGGPDSHTVMHTFEVKPSSAPFNEGLLLGSAAGTPAPLLAAVNLESVRQRYRLDELLFQWHDLPPAAEATVFFSDIDTAVIQALAAFRGSPLACEIVDQHTLRLPVAGATWIPLPGGRELNIPALLAIRLPDDVAYGQEFRVTVHQVDGAEGRVIGSCEFRIPVSKAELIVGEERRSLSVLRHVVGTIPPSNRWYPLMQRYVAHLGRKVDALGGDAAAVHGNPDGSGRPYEPRPERPDRPRPHDHDHDHEGRPCCGCGCGRRITITIDGCGDCVRVS